MMAILRMCCCDMKNDFPGKKGAEYGRSLAIRKSREGANFATLFQGSPDFAIHSCGKCSVQEPDLPVHRLLAQTRFMKLAPILLLATSVAALADVRLPAVI